MVLRMLLREGAKDLEKQVGLCVRSVLQETYALLMGAVPKADDAVLFL